MNTSGGLVSKGHPVGAAGLSMLAELTTQLRGEAGARQVKGAEIALAENGGGVIGMERGRRIGGGDSSARPKRSDLDDEV